MAAEKGQGRSGTGSGGRARAAGNAKGKTTNGRRATAAPVKATIHSDYAAGLEVQQRILDLAVQHGYQEQCLFAIKIAVEEAIVNAIKHGNKLDKTKHVIIEATISPQQAEITIEDEGPGFLRTDVPDPLADENIEKPSGRGILLIESYMTRVSWDHGGRRVRMVKNRSDGLTPGCVAPEED